MTPYVLFQSVRGTLVSLLLDFPGSMKHRGPLSPWNTIFLNIGPPHSLGFFSHFSGHSWGPVLPPVPLSAPLHLVVTHCPALYPSLFSLQGLCLGLHPPPCLQIPAVSWCFSNSTLALIVFLCPKTMYPLDPTISACPKLRSPTHFHIPCLREWRLQKPICQTRNLAIILEDKNTLSCQAYLLNVSDTTPLFIWATILVHSSHYNRIPRLGGL